MDEYVPEECSILAQYYYRRRSVRRRIARISPSGWREGARRSRSSRAAPTTRASTIFRPTRTGRATGIHQRRGDLSREGRSARGGRRAVAPAQRPSHSSGACSCSFCPARSRRDRHGGGLRPEHILDRPGAGPVPPVATDHRGCPRYRKRIGQGAGAPHRATPAPRPVRGARANPVERGGLDRRLDPSDGAGVARDRRHEPGSDTADLGQRRDDVAARCCPRAASHDHVFG